MITRGELRLSIDGQTATYRTGDWYQVPAGVLHAAEFAEETDEIEFRFKADGR